MASLKQFFFAHLYAPLFWAGFVLPVILAGPRDPRESPMIFFLLGAILVSFLAERISPFNADWNRNKNDGVRDFFHAVVNHLTMIGFMTAVYYLFDVIKIPTLQVWPRTWPFFVQVMLALLIADALMTFAHYISHRNEFLWRLHSVHHSVKRVYAFNGLMKHPVHKFFEASCGFIPLFLLGMPVWLGFFTGYVAAIHFFLSHANVNMKNRFLSKSLALASVHRFHHLQKRRSAVNYGIMFNFWDMMLGTFHDDPKAVLVTEELGIRDYPDYPDDYLSQMIIPFRGWRSKSE